MEPRLTSWVFGWVYLVTLSQALLFSYRTVRRLPRIPAGSRDWKQGLRDEYVRNDFYAALHGWVGLVVLTAVWTLFGPWF